MLLFLILHLSSHFITSSLCLNRCSLHAWLQPNRLPDMCIPSWENGLEVLISRTLCDLLLSSHVPGSKTFTLGHHTYDLSMPIEGCRWGGDTFRQRSRSSLRKNSSQLQTWRSDNPSHHLHHPVLFSEDFTSLMLCVFLSRSMSNTFCHTDCCCWPALILVSFLFLYTIDEIPKIAILHFLDAKWNLLFSLSQLTQTLKSLNGLKIFL